jgi:RNA polymerase nonessential primary-like sigma factor
MEQKITINIIINSEDNLEYDTNASSSEIAPEIMAEILLEEKEVVKTTTSGYNAKSNTKELFVKAKGGDTKARNELINNNMGLVYKLAHQYKHFGVEFDELINEGVLALDHAIKKFNPDMNFQFSTYAYWWVKQRLLAHLNKYNRSVPVSSDTLLILRKIKKVQKELVQRLGGEPSIEIWATTAEMTEDELTRWLSYDRHYVLDSHEVETQYGHYSDDTEAVSQAAQTTAGVNNAEAYTEEITSDWYEIVESCTSLSSVEKVILHDLFISEKSIAYIMQKLKISYITYKKLYASALAKLRETMK